MHMWYTNNIIFIIRKGVESDGHFSKHSAPCGIIWHYLRTIRQNSDPIIYYGKLDWKLMTSTGGMPSSHSAAVTSLTTAIAYEAGLDSPLFAVSAIFAVIVMFDATGIRYQADNKQLLSIKCGLTSKRLCKKQKDGNKKMDNKKFKNLKHCLGINRVKYSPVQSQVYSFPLSFIHSLFNNRKTVC